MIVQVKNLENSDLEYWFDRANGISKKMSGKIMSTWLYIGWMLESFHLFSITKSNSVKVCSLAETHRDEPTIFYGSSALEAVKRCFIVMKLGESINVQELDDEIIRTKSS